MLKERITSGVLMGGALLAALFFLPWAFMPVILAPVLLLAAWEFQSLIEARGVRSLRWIGVGGALLLATVTWGGQFYYCPQAGQLEACVIYLVLAAILLRALCSSYLAQPWDCIAGNLLAFLYVAFLFNFIVKLLLLGDVEGRRLILYLALVVKFTDIGAFSVGCSIGRHKFCPRISPAKTWEGVVGGVICGTAISVAYHYVAGGRIGAYEFSLLQAIGFGLVLAVAGVAGDLVESVFKRASGVKDSAAYIRGMGGILDVVDSLLFTAPLLYLLTQFCMERTPV